MSLDPTIWNRICQDDEEAYAEVYRFLFRRFYNYGIKFTNDTILIEDAIQETLLLLWEKRKSLTTIRYSTTYFYSIFRNILISKLRKLKTTKATTELNELQFSVEQIIIEKEMETHQKMRLTKAIDHLTARQMEAIFLRFYEGLSYDEVAAVLNITTKATYKIVSRAIAQLREVLMLLLMMI